MKDILGQEIKVGSIMFHYSGRGDQSVVRAIGFTKKAITSWSGLLPAVEVECLATFSFGHKEKRVKKNSSITSTYTLLVIDEITAAQALKKE